MLACCTYDSTGKFACRLGLPAESGVGSGILAVVPKRCTLSVWGPGSTHAETHAPDGRALDTVTILTGCRSTDHPPAATPTVVVAGRRQPAYAMLTGAAPGRNPPNEAR
jgi:hypothetical protein